MSSTKEIKIPLGGDIFLTCSTWNGVRKAHIRKFISVKSLYEPHKTIVLPTKHGVTLTKAQALQLKTNIDLVIAAFEDEAPRTSPSNNIHLAGGQQEESNQEGGFYPPAFNNLTYGN